MMNWEFRKGGKEKPLARRMHDVTERVEAAGGISGVSGRTSQMDRVLESLR